MTKTLCFDLDGCFFDFTKAYANLLIALAGDKLPKGWETDDGFPATWNWDVAAGYTVEEIKQAWGHITVAKNQFWRSLEPLPHARETLMMLNGLQKRGTAIWFISHRMGENAHWQTAECLYDHGTDYPCLFFAGDKVPYLRLLEADFFVDDKPETVTEVARVAAEERWPKLDLYMKTTPYNAGVAPVGFTHTPSVKEALIESGLWE